MAPKQDSGGTKSDNFATNSSNVSPLTESFSRANVSSKPEGLAKKGSSKSKQRAHTVSGSELGGSADTDGDASRWAAPEAGRKGVRKAPVPISTRAQSSSRKSSGSESGSGEIDAAVLSPISDGSLEGKDGDQSGRRGSSASSPKFASQQIRQGIRNKNGLNAARGRASKKRQSLSNGTESLFNLQNQSLLSVSSGVTTSSGVSSGSNSTITQKSYDKACNIKRRQGKEKGKKAGDHKTLKKQKQSLYSNADFNVFQYMNPTGTASSLNVIQENMSTRSNSPTDDKIATGDGGSSSANEKESASEDEEHEEVEEKDDDTNIHHERLHSDSGISVRGSSPALSNSADKQHKSTLQEHEVSMLESESDSQDEGDIDAEIDHGKSRDKAEDDEDSEDEDGEEEDEEEEEQEDGDDDEDDEEDDEGSSAGDSGHKYGLEKVPYESYPQPYSHAHPDLESERLRERLRYQEEDLRQHILQNPQPQREIRFTGNPSNHSTPALAYAQPDYRYQELHEQMFPPTAPPPPPPMTYMPFHSMSASLPPYSQSQIAFPYGNPQPLNQDLAKVTVTGYELMARKLSEAQRDQEISEKPLFSPMYRKFERLNHRVLLHLQDEISEMEEELRQLDECIAQLSPGSLQQASRRSEARYGGNLHFNRVELLGRIYLKLGQYNQALSSFNSLARDLNRADDEEISAYRTWAEKHAPVEKSELRFLNHSDDLLAVGKSAGSSSQKVTKSPSPPELDVPEPKKIDPEPVKEEEPKVAGDQTTDSFKLVFSGLPLVLLLPIIAFAIIPGIMARMAMMTLIGLAEATVVTNTELVNLMDPQNWITCASIYFAVMALLAALIR